MYTVDPVYNDIYRPGFIGFTYRDNSIFSKGVALFTRTEADNIVVSHTFMVVDDKLAIEASILNGVVYRKVSEFFDDPHTMVMFKKPIGLDSDVANKMIAKIESHLGCSYDLSLICYFIERFILNKLGINRLFKRKSLFDSDNEYICSELVADAIMAIPKYAAVAPFFNTNPYQIEPMMIFRSPIFKEWKY